MAVPAKFRGIWVPVPSHPWFGQSLFLYPHDQWDKIAGKLAALPISQAGTPGLPFATNARRLTGMAEILDKQDG